MSEVLCITGMHRSGTSLVTSWLERCGLTIDDGRLMQGGVGNPHGHFEDKEFVALHSEWIRSVARRSQGWIYERNEPIQVTQGFYQAANNLVARRNRSYASWGWKDPRSTLFLEIWKEIIPELKVLLLWRPCQEVLGSLVRRSSASDADVCKIHDTSAIRTWCAYNERALAYYRRHQSDTLMVRTCEVLKNDLFLLDAIREKLGITLEYQAISNLYDSQLLRAHSPSIKQRIMMRFYETARLERELQHRSASFINQLQR